MSDLEDLPTGTAPRPTPATPAANLPPDAVVRTPSSGTSARRLATGVGPGRFAPGAILADRYRILGLLGRGGMGEVYRADDLKLDQPVALKFLSEAVEGDAESLARFYSEARLARAVTHPAVCRVHDIGEVDGHAFLSMEYVDGEDLSTVRKRLGRLSTDKAIEVARQVCAGLAAAHAKGVLHRDLKPSNIMVDGEGRARITDFGLAGVAESIRGDDVRSGTPAYMSPEQIEGREVTVRSDIFSLGLLLYELVTGRRAFDGKTLAEVMRQRAEPPPRPSDLAPGLDPRVEAAILRCLQRDPRRRPASALAVAAALPGGDALASLFATGDTPSPEMLAAAGDAEDRVPSALAWAALATVIGGLFLVPWLSAPLQLTSVVPFEKPPAVLEDRARELVRRLGLPETPADTATGFSVDADYLRHVRQNDPSPSRWEGLRTGTPPVLLFWYRQSPQLLSSRSLSGEVFWTNPPQTMSGMVSLKLDTRGRLVSFFAVPPQVEPAASGSEAEGQPASYDALFEAAALDRGAFRPVAPRWTPPFFADHRAAFEGSLAERPDLKVRIEAASWRGRPVAFYPVADWTRPEREVPFQVSPSMEASRVLFALVFVSLFVTALLLARHHLRTGRADRAGSMRLALGTLLLGVASWAARAHHLGLRNEEIGLFILGTSGALFISLVLWLFYVALEPFVRRLWPHALISWTRLLANGPRDPLVARDLLAGMAVGSVIAVVYVAGLRLPAWLGRAAEPHWTDGLDALLGVRYGLDLLFTVPLAAAGLATGTFLLLVLLRLVLKRELLAAAVLVVVFGTINALRFDLPPAWAVPLSMLLMVGFMFVALRFGLLAYVVAATVVDLWLRNPLSTDLSSFRGEPTLLVSFVILAVALFAFRQVRKADPSGVERSPGRVSE